MAYAMQSLLDITQMATAGHPEVHQRLVKLAHQVLKEMQIMMQVLQSQAKMQEPKESSGVRPYSRPLRAPRPLASR